MGGTLNGQIAGVMGIVVVALTLGWAAGRIFDPGVETRGLPLLAGLIGLTAGTWLAAQAGWDAGPAIMGYSLVPSFLGTLATCGVLRMLTLGVAGSRC